MKRTTLLRVLCAAMAICLLFPCLFSCGKQEATVNETQVVGTVGDQEILYDELYCLVQRYYDTVKETCGSDPVKMQAELDRLVKEHITANPAILALCGSLGLAYDEKDWKDEIDKELDEIVSKSYGGDENAYLEDMRTMGLTERYLRYTTGLDLLYGSLLKEYPERGLVVKTDGALKQYIKDNFIHVYHLALFNDTEEEKAANYQKMSEAAELLQSGKATMYQLIKKGYTEDFSDVSAEGYYIAKGTMEQAYEDTAFALGMNEVSGVVEAMGKNNQNKTVSCYYVIQRVAIDEEYVNSHLTLLQNEYYGSVIAADLDEIKKTLSFTPNEFYDSLDLCNLLPPVRESRAWIVALCVSGGILLLAAAVIPVVIVKKKHAKKNV